MTSILPVNVKLFVVLSKIKLAEPFAVPLSLKITWVFDPPIGPVAPLIPEKPLIP